MSKNETKNITELIKKPELYLGIATLIVMGTFVVRATYNPVAKIAERIIPTITTMPSPTISPTNTVIVVKPSIAPTGEAKKNIKKVTKFADTGTIKLYVKEGDNFWTIAEQVCGNGVLADSLKEQNGYGEESLQPGDMLTISCE